jgi:hypothetical protein
LFSNTWNRHIAELSFRHVTPCASRHAPPHQAIAKDPALAVSDQSGPWTRRIQAKQAQTNEMKPNKQKQTNSSKTRKTDKFKPNTQNGRAERKKTMRW